jgi:hypothetical protein
MSHCTVYTVKYSIERHKLKTGSPGSVGIVALEESPSAARMSATARRPATAGTPTTPGTPQ